MSYTQSITINNGKVSTHSGRMEVEPALPRYPADTRLAVAHADKKGSSLMLGVPKDRIVPLTQDVANFALGCYGREHVTTVTHEGGKITPKTLRGVLSLMGKVDYPAHERLIIVSSLDSLIGEGEEVPTEIERSGIEMLNQCIAKARPELGGDAPAIMALSSQDVCPATLNSERKAHFAVFGAVALFNGDESGIHSRVKADQLPVHV